MQHGLLPDEYPVDRLTAPKMGQLPHAAATRRLATFAIGTIDAIDGTEVDMGLRSRMFALTYDRQMAKVEKAGLRALRERLLGGATRPGPGDRRRHRRQPALLRAGVGSLTLTEPETAMVRRLERRAARAGAGGHGPAGARRGPAVRGRHLRRRRVDAGALRRDDQPRALRQLRRVLRPGGQLLFIEHVRSDDAAARPPAGPHELAQPLRRALRLQPADAQLHRERGVRCHAGRAPRPCRRRRRS